MRALRRLLQVFFVALGLQAVEANAADWVYMDLGEVIVTGNPTQGYTYVPGALEFLQALHEEGFKLALMSNIPESWGTDCQVKLHTLEQFLGSRLNEPAPFDWTRFDAVVLPPFDRYRKPHQFMFTYGLARACPERAIFIGESQSEVDMAKGLGMATFHKDHGVDLPKVDAVRDALAADFSFEHPAACDFEPLFAEILQPQDVGVVQGCAANPAIP